MKNSTKTEKCALIFAGGNFPDKNKALPLLNRILANLTCEQNFSISSSRQNTVMLAADSGLVCAHNYGLNCQYFLGDMDSVPEDLAKQYKNLETFTFEKDKDYSDTELAFMKAEETGCGFNILVGGSGGRMDHFLALFAMFAQKNYPDIWLTEENIFICLDFPASANICVSGLSPKDAVSVFAVTVPPYFCAQNKTEKPVCKSKNLVWALDNLDWHKGFYSLSNRVAAPDEALELKAENGRFILVLPLKPELNLKFF